MKRFIKNIISDIRSLFGKFPDTTKAKTDRCPDYAGLITSMAAKLNEIFSG